MKECSVTMEQIITIISYLLEAVANGKVDVRVISDDTDIFVLLVWSTQITSQVQLHRWSGDIININKISTKLVYSLVTNLSNCLVCTHFQAVPLYMYLIHLVMGRRWR